MYLKINGLEAYAATRSRAPEPSKPTVVFVHGSGQDHSIWALPARYFSRHDRNVLAVDLPGHGRSAGGPLESVEAMADWLIAWLDATGLGQAAIVGHSLGSLVAISASARHPDRVRAIALIGTTLPMRVSPVLLENARTNSQEAIDMLTNWGFSESTRARGGPTSGHRMLNAARRLLERARAGVIYADLSACNAYHAGLEEAAKVDCPALLILGEHDRLTPARSAARLADAMPHAETAILEGCGHAMLYEQPARVLDQLTRVV